MLRLVSALLAGLAFGAGLVLSGMADPEKVLAFLDLAAIADGKWDHLPEAAFMYVGPIEQAEEQAKKMELKK